MEDYQYGKLIGGILGIIAFLWKIWDVVSSYLHISVQVSKTENMASVKTQVQNKSLRGKSLTKALLLIGPENEDPLETANYISKEIGQGIDFEYTNDIEFLQARVPIYSDNKRALVPLPFFYSEQVRVADESLTYRASLDLSKLEKNLHYSVRFFIFGKNRLHRSTQDLFYNG